MLIALCSAQVIHSQVSASSAYIWSFSECKGINIISFSAYLKFLKFFGGLDLGKSLVTIKIFSFCLGLRNFFLGKFFSLIIFI